jgi:hypothetical protein
VAFFAGLLAIAFADFLAASFFAAAFLGAVFLGAGFAGGFGNARDFGELFEAVFEVGRLAVTSAAGSVDSAG